MADATATIIDEESTLNVPPEVEKDFHELVALIRESRSMDDDERQYWVDVLPIMSEDQTENLRGILDNEKKQLAEAAAAYTGGMEENMQNVGKEFNAEEYKEKKLARLEAERMHEEEEHQHEENILKELENL